MTRDAMTDDGGGRPHAPLTAAERWRRERYAMAHGAPARGVRRLSRGGLPRGAAGDRPTGCAVTRPLDTEAVTRAMLTPTDPAPKHRLPLLAPDRKRPATLSMRRQGKRALAAGAALYPVAEMARYARPVTRGDCLAGGVNEARPCPFASCKHHLALDVSARNGNIKVAFPDVAIEHMAETCALDVADRGGETLEIVGAVMNLTRERIRQLEDGALEDLIGGTLTRELAGLESVDSRGEVAWTDDGSGARTDREAIDTLTDFSYGAGGPTRT